MESTTMLNRLWEAAVMLAPLIVPLLLGGVSLALLLPSRQARPKDVAIVLGGMALAVFGLTAFRPSDAWLHDGLFLIFAGLAVLAGVATISQSNPVYAALWFAVVVLSSCGLFLLRSAPFLAAATIIVYAGAIIVTFLFVIMLAQQNGLAAYDQRSSHPWLATSGAFVLLALLLLVLGQAFRQPATEAVIASAGNDRIGHVVGLGTALYGRYFLSIELAGTLLTLAVVGAIVLAPSRTSRTGSVEETRG